MTANMPMPSNGHNIIKALGKGIFLGIALVLPFAVSGALLSAMGITYPFVTNIGDMGLLGFFIGLGIEIYPVLI
ncbi:MAG: hypothetical protein QW478_15110 [Candidatus Micrarchaeaceae archaeon]